MFAPVTREKNRLRLALDGPSGSGKTYTALRFAFALAGEKGRVAVIDTEYHSATKYQGENPDGITWQWDGCDLESFAPSTYEQVIKYAGEKKYDVLVIDSLSHAWTGVDGALDQLGKSKSRNSFTAWKDVTPQHEAMVTAILSSPCHVIATLRSKMEYVIEEDEKGKTVVRKVGLKPIQRSGVEYEFDIICDMDEEHLLKVSKTRCPAVDGKVVMKPDALFVNPIRTWLFSGLDPNYATRLSAAKPIRAATSEQTSLIKNLCKSLGMSPVRLLGILAKKGVGKIGDLSFDDANTLRLKLEAKLLAKEGEEAF